MRLKAFDKNKNYSVKRVSPKIMFVFGIIVAGLIGIVIFESYALYKTNNTINFIEGKVGEFSTTDIKVAVYVDGEKSDEFPAKASRKAFEKLECTNSGVASWNNDNWSLSITNIINPTNCNVYFVDNPCLDFEDKLECKILAQYGLASLIEAKGNPDFSVVPTAQNSGLYATEDEYGTSYYYRGLKGILANNVIFAEHQWKIIRINGDRSIRLIYNGTCPNNSCTINSTGVVTAINNGTEYAWNTTNRDDAKYVGYMYGGINGEASTSKEQAQTNETDSNAKTVLDAWYVNNIKNTKYEQYIVDNIFCNDRSITSGPGYNVSESITDYKAYTRIYVNHLNPTPTLKCEQKNDRFTVNDIMLGNGVLSYPIGLITADEMQYVGIGYSVFDTNNYLYTGERYWSLTPHRYVNGLAASVLGANLNGGYLNSAVAYKYGLRGVINLSSDIIVKSGDGTASTPYIISD